jgi:uncharacterized protein (TIGR04255 family)
VTKTASGKKAVRPKAEGFPVAPLFEAVLAVQFADQLTDANLVTMGAALERYYPTKAVSAHREINIDAASETVEVKEARKAYRLEGEDDTEVALLRPDTFTVSQLAPYKSWEVLFGRFARDFRAIRPHVADLPVTRIACRSLNRIDVPVERSLAKYEEYLAVHIHLPEKIPSIGEFQFQFMLSIPELQAKALVQSGVMPPATPNCASFLLDIDLFRIVEIPQDTDELFDLLAKFRGYKNDLYRSFLTKKALEEFER